MDLLVAAVRLPLLHGRSRVNWLDLADSCHPGYDINAAIIHPGISLHNLRVILSLTKPSRKPTFWNLVLHHPISSDLEPSVNTHWQYQGVGSEKGIPSSGLIAQRPSHLLEPCNESKQLWGFKPGKNGYILNENCLTGREE